VPQESCSEVIVRLLVYLLRISHSQSKQRFESPMVIPKDEGERSYHPDAFWTSLNNLPEWPSIQPFLFGLMLFVHSSIPLIVAGECQRFVSGTMARKNLSVD
jgi:hypothetical protein